MLREMAKARGKQSGKSSQPKLLGALFRSLDAGVRFLKSPKADGRAAKAVQTFLRRNTGEEPHSFEPVASLGGLVAFRTGTSAVRPSDLSVCNPTTSGIIHRLGRPWIVDQAYLLLTRDGGRCFQLHVLNLDLLRHHKQLQIQIFCSDDEKEGWGSTISTFADLPPSAILRPSPLVLDGVAYWLCSLSDYAGHAYVLPLHLNGWRPPAPIWLPDKLTRMNWDIKKREVLLASSPDGKELALVTVRGKTITMWTLQSPSYGCWRESLEVDLREVARRSRGMAPLTDEKIKLECFAERSGAVLFRIYHGTLYELNLRTRKIKYLGLYTKSGSSNMCAYDMN